MPTSQAKTFKRTNSGANRTDWPRGFTLLEIMIVMGIAAALVMLAMPRLSSQNNQMRQAVRRLSSLTRQLQTNAKLQGAVYRLVIDLKKGEKDQGQTYWVEKATSKTVLSASEMTDTPQEEKSNSNDEKKAELFQKDTKLIKGDSELPSQLHFEDVELKRFEAPIVSGKAYIHFFPQGLSEEAAIHLKANEKLRWTLAIQPLTGKSDILTEHVTLKEISGQ